MADDKIVIKFDGNMAQLDKKLNKTDKQVKKLRVSTAGVGKALKASATVAAVGFAALTGAVAGSISIFREQEQAEIRTRKTIEATGSAAGLTADEIFDMASELQNVTTIGDEAIISGQNLLLTFRNIGKETFPRATEAMLDMATAMGTDMKSSAIQLGKALNDPVAGISALSRVGITFSDEQKKQIKQYDEAGNAAKAQAVILSELENQFGGVSRAATEGTGALIQTKNLLGDVAEEIGRAVLPAVLSLNTALSSILKDSDSLLNKTIKGIGDAIAQEFESGGVKAMTSLVEVNDKLEKLDKTKKKLQAQLAGEGGFLFNFVPDSSIEERLQKNAEDRLTALKQQAELEKEIETRRLSDLHSLRVNKIQENLKAESEIKKEAALSEAELLNEVDTEIFAAQFETRKAHLDEIARLVEANVTADYDAKREVAAEDIKNQIKENKLRKKEEVKYGKDLAKMSAFFRSEEYKGASTALDALATLSESGNKTLGAIAKAAGVTRAIMNTAQAVTGALKEVPYPYNFIAAASVGAAGAVQVAKISSAKFAKGGLVEGGLAGIDSVPAMMQQGELVVPRQNFDEVINAVRSSREESSTQNIVVELSFKDDIGDFIEANILERRILGVGAI